MRVQKIIRISRNGTGIVELHQDQLSQSVIQQNIKKVMSAPLTTSHIDLAKVE